MKFYDREEGKRIFYDNQNDLFFIDVRRIKNWLKC
jgi:hypothetical protein